MTTTTTNPSSGRLRRGLATAAIAFVLVGGSAGVAGAQERPPSDTTGGCQFCHDHKDLPLPAPDPEPDDEPDTGESLPDDEPDPRCDPKIESCP